MIELGELATSPGREPGDDTPGPGVSRRSIRQAGLIAITVLTLLGVTGSAIPEPRGVRPLWNAPMRESDTITATGDSVFLSRTDDDLTQLTVHDITTGAVRWSREVRGTSGWAQPVQDDRLVLLPSNRKVVTLGLGSEEAFTTEFHRETIALDARTGEERWTAAGEPYVTARETALLAEHTDDGKISRYRLIRLADGGTIWSKDATGFESQTTAMRGDEPDRLITATSTGEISVFRYADGSLITRGKVPWTLSRPEQGYFNDLSAAGDYLVVNQSKREDVRQYVYRIDTMTPLWQAGTANGYAYICGNDRLCLTEGSRIVARELATGRQSWELEAGGNIFPVNEHRLLSDSGMDDGRPALIDADTGRIISSADGSTVWNYEPGDVVMLLRPTEHPYGRTMVFRWDLDDGRRHLLGAIDSQTAQRCQAVPGYLLCGRDGEIEVTAVG